MSTTAILMMIAICGLVWGGFLVLLTRAVRREAVKRRREGDAS